MNQSQRSTLIRLALVLAGLGLVAIIWMITHPLGPGSVSITISAHTEFPAGAAEKLKITMRSEHGDPIWTLVSWGDGRKNDNSFALSFHGPCSQPMPVFGGTPPPLVVPKASTLPPGQSYIEFLHRYRRPGTYKVTVQADEFRLCNQRSPSGTASILLHVSGATAPGNGPADPQPGLGLNSYNFGVLTAYFDAGDVDGYVRSMTVTWIDGSTHVYANSDQCKDSADAWPVSRMGFRWTKRLAPGIYVIKVAALSTDCRGGNPQAITGIFQFHLIPTGSRVYWLHSTYLPHDPKGNGDSSLPTSSVYDFPFRPAP